MLDVYDVCRLCMLFGAVAGCLYSTHIPKDSTHWFDFIVRHAFCPISDDLPMTSVEYFARGGIRD